MRDNIVQIPLKVLPGKVSGAFILFDGGWDFRRVSGSSRNKEVRITAAKDHIFSPYNVIG